MRAHLNLNTGGADIRLAFLTVWGIVSAALLVTVLLPLVVPQDVIGRAIPACEWQARYGRPCPLCGLTTAFYHIAGGQWRAASQANGASLPLYLLFWANGLAALAVLSWKSGIWRRSPARQANSRCLSLEE